MHGHEQEMIANLIQFATYAPAIVLLAVGGLLYWIRR